MAKKHDDRPGRLDGVINPQGLIFVAVVPILSTATVPITSYLTTPGSFVQRAMHVSIQLVPGVVPNDRIIPALAAIYIFAAICFSAGLSVAGQASSQASSADSNHPRLHLANLRGLPLRMHSAHQNILENFPAWALTAAFAQMLSPRDQQIINLLGLAMLVKVFGYWPAYVVDFWPMRSLCHLIHSSAVINTAFRIAAGA